MITRKISSEIERKLIATQLPEADQDSIRVITVGAVIDYSDIAGEEVCEVHLEHARSRGAPVVANAVLYFQKTYLESRGVTSKDSLFALVNYKEKSGRERLDLVSLKGPTQK